jgi:hypothetical protein
LRTLHIVGSNDNFGRTPEMDAEHAERKAANIAWLKRTIAQAKTDGSLGLVLMTQANLIFEKHWSGDRRRLFLTYAGVGKRCWGCTILLVAVLSPLSIGE